MALETIAASSANVSCGNSGLDALLVAVLAANQEESTQSRGFFSSGPTHQAVAHLAGVMKFNHEAQGVLAGGMQVGMSMSFPMKVGNRCGIVADTSLACLSVVGMPTGEFHDSR